MLHGEKFSRMEKEDLCILFPVDLGDSTSVLLPAIQEMREIGIGEVRLLHVIHPVDVLAVPDIIDERQKTLQQHRKVLIGYGIPRVRGEVVIGTPWMEIAERARSADIAFIVMGSQGKGLLERIFLGSVTENVLYHTNNSLFILRLHEEDDRYSLAQERLFTHILYATDLSEGSRRGISFIERMARSAGQLTIAFVEDVRHLEYASPEILEEMRVSAERELNALQEQFLVEGFHRVDIVLRKGNAIGELLQLVDQIQPSLLVIGAKGQYSIAERALGGVAETLVHRAPVHILLGR
jgi:nucleotide-binding universal stress UspA family protein